MAYFSARNAISWYCNAGLHSSEGRHLISRLALRDKAGPERTLNRKSFVPEGQV
jgi:hypothetical protein